MKPVARFEHALELMLTQRGDPSAEIERALADDPQSVFGHCLRLALIVRADDISARSVLVASIAAIEAACPDRDDPARRHASAARAWFEGHPDLAVERYSAIVRDDPRDILALVAAHALDFHLGQRRSMRNRLARALPHWKPAMPGYEGVLAMYAFALEESGQYRRAEKMARRALALNSKHPYAIHVVAHVMEMQGRAREGLEFLAATETVWAHGSGFSVHLAWHRALFHLDANDPMGALKIYDEKIANAQSWDKSQLADASALLWRLELQNIDVGKRWRALADRWETQKLAGARPFYIVHAMMAFAAARRTAAVARLMEIWASAHASDELPAFPEEALAPPFCEALLAFVRSDYSASVEWLTRVRHIAHRCGGSLAQCDLIHLTFTEAALRAHRARLARSLVAERTAKKPASLLNRLLMQRLPAAA